MEKKFGRKRAAKDIIISVATLAAGAACLFIGTDIWSGIGIVLLALGLTFVLAFKSAFKLPGDEKTYSRKVFTFAQTQREMLNKALKGEGVLDLKKQGTGTAIMLYLYLSLDGTRAYAQRFDFSDYRYQPASELVPVDPAAILGL